VYVEKSNFANIVCFIVFDARRTRHFMRSTDSQSTSSPLEMGTGRGGGGVSSLVWMPQAPAGTRMGPLEPAACRNNPVVSSTVLYRTPLPLDLHRHRSCGRGKRRPLLWPRVQPCDPSPWHGREQPCGLAPTVLDLLRGWLHNTRRGCCAAQHRRLGRRLGKRSDAR